MPTTPTPILGLIVPTIGGDNNLWGAELNADLATLDNLGAASVVPFSVDTTASVGIFPEKTYRGTSGGGVVSLTLPSPVGISGKIFMVIKVDSGVGTINIVGTINGLASYALSNQWQYARIQSNGATYDVIGNN